MIVKNAFLIVFFLIFAILDISIGYCIIHFNTITLFHFIIFQLINIGVAYGIAEFFLSLAVKRKDLPKLDKLGLLPKVALLYTTYNDVLPAPLSRLNYQVYGNYDIFILDDSTNKTQIDIIKTSGYRIIRRDNRRGFKAGALNNWLSIYGDDYDYFIISDADSLFDDDFIEKMVKYAEHPSNENVAIFQSKIIGWNSQARFARIMAATTPMTNYINDKLANECSTILSWGHNNLHRTRPIKEVGGFDEAFTSEDYATSIHLISRGYECKLVDVVSYEMVPETIQSYSNRSVRWAKQNLELLSLDISCLSFGSRLHLFMSIYYYIIWMVYGIGILLVIYGYKSTFGDIVALIYFLLDFENVRMSLSTSSYLALALFIFYNLNFTFMRLPLALKLGISFKDYCKNLLLSMAVSYYIMFDIIIAQVRTIGGQKVTFDVTDKGSSRATFVDTLKYFKDINIFIILVIIGILRNPLSLILNIIWLVPLIASPFVIYLAHERTQELDEESSQNY